MRLSHMRGSIIGLAVTLDMVTASRSLRERDDPTIDADRRSLATTTTRLTNHQPLTTKSIKSDA